MSGPLETCVGSDEMVETFDPNTSCNQAFLPNIGDMKALARKITDDVKNLKCTDYKNRSEECRMKGRTLENIRKVVGRAACGNEYVGYLKWKMSYSTGKAMDVDSELNKVCECSFCKDPKFKNEVKAQVSDAMKSDKGDRAKLLVENMEKFKKEANAKLASFMKSHSKGVVKHQGFKAPAKCELDEDTTWEYQTLKYELTEKMNVLFMGQNSLFKAFSDNQIGKNINSQKLSEESLRKRLCDGATSDAFDFEPAEAFEEAQDEVNEKYRDHLDRVRHQVDGAGQVGIHNGYDYNRATEEQIGRIIALSPRGSMNVLLQEPEMVGAMCGFMKNSRDAGDFDDKMIQAANVAMLLTMAPMGVGAVGAVVRSAAMPLTASRNLALRAASRNVARGGYNVERGMATTHEVTTNAGTAMFPATAASDIQISREKLRVVESSFLSWNGRPGERDELGAAGRHRQNMQAAFENIRERVYLNATFGAMFGGAQIARWAKGLQHIQKNCQAGAPALAAAEALEQGIASPALNLCGKPFAP